MIDRMIKLSGQHSFFLFGPRQTGKSTLLKTLFSSKTTLYYDLLKSEEFLRLTANPSIFREEVLARHPDCNHVIIDEIQRVPQLLNEVHAIIEEKGSPVFVMSGSSARKLKRSKSNLLAGRAWSYSLFPLTHVELGGSFFLDKALNLGALPSVYLSANEDDARHTLKAYVDTYLKEEIQEEAIVRNLSNFLRFLVLAGDENGNVINYSNIARETGTSYHTVKEYFQILEDTLIGFFLFPYAKSSRKRLVKHPKFYFFDIGVQRALAKKISVPLERKTSDYGRAFEHFIIAEAIRLASYHELDYTFSFYGSSGQSEVDLIIETPRNRTIAVEIKATDNPNTASLRGLRSFARICPSAELYCVSLVPHKRIVEGICILSWKELFQEFFLQKGGSSL